MPRTIFLLTLATLALIQGDLAQADTISLSLNFNETLYRMHYQTPPAPDRLVGSVGWSFDSADPTHTLSVTSIDLTLGGRPFALSELEIFYIPSPLQELISSGANYNGTVNSVIEDPTIKPRILV